MAHVPLEQRSTARLLLDFIVLIILPVVAVIGFICFCIVQFGGSLGDFLSHLPWPF